MPCQVYWFMPCDRCKESGDWSIDRWILRCRQTSNTRRVLVGNKLADHADVVGVSPVGDLVRLISNISRYMYLSTVCRVTAHRHEQTWLGSRAANVWNRCMVFLIHVPAYNQSYHWYILNHPLVQKHLVLMLLHLQLESAWQGANFYLMLDLPFWSLTPNHLSWLKTNGDSHLAHWGLITNIYVNNLGCHWLSKMLVTCSVLNQCQNQYDFRSYNTFYTYKYSCPDKIRQSQDQTPLGVT